MELALGFLCLALNVYFEAGHEPQIGQLAVAHVTLNRARKKGRSVCDEVYSPYQFSWTLELQQAPEPTDKAWIQAQHVAKLAYQTKDPTGGAMWYHRHDITPYWKWVMTEVARYGDHIFYVCEKGETLCNWR